MTFRYKLKGQEAYSIQVQTKESRGLCHSGTRAKRPMTFRNKLKGQEAYAIQVQIEGSRGLRHSDTN